MAKWIPSGKVIKHGRIESSVYIEVQKIPKWLNIDLNNQQIHDNIEYFITAYKTNEDKIKLNIVLNDMPEDINKWCQSFDGYITHTFEINRNVKEIRYARYVEHDLELHDKKEINKVIYYIDTYDLLIPEVNGDLYKSKVYYYDEYDNYIYLELNSYATGDEAIKEHKKLIEKWFKSA